MTKELVVFMSSCGQQANEQAKAKPMKATRSNSLSFLDMHFDFTAHLRSANYVSLLCVCVRACTLSTFSSSIKYFTNAMHACFVFTLFHSFRLRAHENGNRRPSDQTITIQHESISFADFNYLVLVALN